jgi:hypothetical protein
MVDGSKVNLTGSRDSLSNDYSRTLDVLRNVAAGKSMNRKRDDSGKQIETLFLFTYLPTYLQYPVAQYQNTRR